MTINQYDKKSLHSLCDFRDGWTLMSIRQIVSNVAFYKQELESTKCYDSFFVLERHKLQINYVVTLYCLFHNYFTVIECQHKFYSSRMNKRRVIAR